MQKQIKILNASLTSALILQDLLTIAQAMLLMIIQGIISLYVLMRAALLYTI